VLTSAGKRRRFLAYVTTVQGEHVRLCVLAVELVRLAAHLAVLTRRAVDVLAVVARLVIEADERIARGRQN